LAGSAGPTVGHRHFHDYFAAGYLMVAHHCWELLPLLGHQLTITSVFAGLSHFPFFSHLCIHFALDGDTCLITPAFSSRDAY